MAGVPRTCPAAASPSEPSLVRRRKGELKRSVGSDRYGVPVDSPPIVGQEARDGSPALGRAERKTLRYRILHAAGRLTCGGRRRQLKIAATWP